MNDYSNDPKLLQYIKEHTKVSEANIRLVLGHEQAYVNRMQKNAKHDVEIDSDELVDYVLSRPDVKLSELDVDMILDLEMKYLLDNGLADYDD